MKYAFIDEHRREFPVVAMARILKVSRSGFYRWCKGTQPGPRTKARAALDERVRTLFETHRGRYGAPRITAELNELGHICDKKTVAGSLRRQGLVARAGRKFKATTNSNHDLPVAKNLLQQDFSSSRPNEKWVQPGMISAWTGGRGPAGGEPEPSVWMD